MPRGHTGDRPIRPVITLLTDFGVSDSYVAEMKAVLLGQRARVDPAIVDVTHDISPQDVLAGSILLERAVRAFGAGTIHIAVVDPGVGSERRIIAARINRQTVLAPDNGLITWAFKRLGCDAVWELTWRPKSRPGATFHGRDVFAPAALLIAQGHTMRRIAEPIDHPILLPITPAKSPDDPVVILHVDHFGNATTNMPAEVLSQLPPIGVRVARRRVPLVRTYSDVAEAKPLALIGSSGLLEIAVRNGSAARELGLRPGQSVRVLFKAARG